MANGIPRVLLAGVGSGCGKTTMTCAILQALTDRGVDTIAFKCGPDYIDPMFHRRITASGGNLDPFFFSRDTLNYLLDKYGKGHELSVIEGVMGYYDGLGAATDRASSYAVSRALDAPVVQGPQSVSSAARPPVSVAMRSSISSLLIRCFSLSSTCMV